MQDVLTVKEILLVVFTAALPYLELRGAIPLAFYYGARPGQAFVISVVGNLLPIIPVMVVLSFLGRWSNKYNIFYHLMNWIQRKTRKQQDKVHKYGFWGLLIFVAIPLPMSGVWTGAAVAHLLGFKKKQTLLALLCGTLIAGVLVTLMAAGIFVIL